MFYGFFVETYSLMTPENHLFNNKLMSAIEDDLGEITDVELLPVENDKHHKYQLNYKSNGILKTSYFKDFKTPIACLLYVGELNYPIKKYKHLL